MITSYEEMSVGAYCALVDTLKDATSEGDRLLSQIAILTGLDTDTILDEPLTEFDKQREAAAFLLVYPTPHAVRDTYTLRGVEYKPTLKDRQMTAGQFIDFNELAKREGADDLWAEMLSVILVPVGKTYGKGYDIGEVQEAIRAELCILDAIALRAFFLTSCEVSARATLPYLERAMRGMQSSREARKEMRKEIRMRLADLRAAGGGFRALMRWLKLPEEIGMQ